MNELILKLIADINIDSLNSKQLLNNYQEHSIDFKFEEKIRMGQIKKFAEDVIPRSRFIFDRYRLRDEDNEQEIAKEPSGSTDEHKVDYFSYFSNHE